MCAAFKDNRRLKAISQNMGHESIDITDRLYGRLGWNDVKDIITRISHSEIRTSDEELFRGFMAFKK